MNQRRLLTLYRHRRLRSISGTGSVRSLQVRPSADGYLVYRYYFLLHDVTSFSMESAPCLRQFLQIVCRTTERWSEIYHSPLEIRYGPGC